MTVREERREAAIELMADHLLAEGMEGARLRPLAAAAGASDRMLLYYFADKDELLAATLERVAMRMAVLLNQAMPSAAPQAFGPLLGQVWAAAGEPALKPFMRLWIELAAGAARGRQPHQRIAGAIADGFQAWLMGRLAVEGEAARPAEAAALLALIEGLLLLDAVGLRATADLAMTRLGGVERSS